MDVQFCGQNFNLQHVRASSDLLIVSSLRRVPTPGVIDSCANNCVLCKGPDE